MKIHRATRNSSDSARPAGNSECEVARERGGVIVLEFILAMPILFIATLAIFQFGILALVVQAGTTAVMEATREGAKVFASGLAFDDADPDPTDDTTIADRIALVADEFLELHGVEIREAGTNDDPDKANARIDIVRNGVSATRGDAVANPTCNRTGSAGMAGDIVVTLCFELVDSTNPTGAGNPVPDWLSTFNMSISDYRFEMTSRANLE